MRLAASATLSLSLLLTGCTLTPTASPTPAQGAALQGKVHGGQQPINGAHVYLFAANTTAYGAASISLLNATNTGNSDSIGAYVLTDSTGSFTITGDYTCTAGQQVYLYALGGNPGAGLNYAAGLLAILGNCPGPSFSSSTFIWIDEVSTVAAAYAFSGFAIDATHVSSSGTAPAQTGIANAFANAANLANLSTGAALTATPAGNGIVPQTELNTLANILASCVNSAVASTGPPNPSTCYTLFNNARSSGSTGTTPTDTATAAINIAHNPGANVTALYTIPPPASAFAPALTSQPNDFTIGLKLSGAGIDVPENLAVDASGNVWIVNAVNSISELGPSSAPVSPSTGGFYSIGGYTGINGPYDIAIDTSGIVWISNPNYATITAVNSSGAQITHSPFSTGTNSRPTYVSIDPSGNIWSTNAPGSGTPGIIEIPAGGGTATTFTGGGLSGPYGMAIDHSGNIWVGNNTTGTVSEFNNAGTSYPLSPFAAGGQYSFPHGIAADGFGNIWVPGYGDTLTILNQAGANAVSDTTPQVGGLSDPYYTVIDGAGNAWIVNETASVSEFSSAGSPISTTGYAFASLSNFASNSATGIAVDGSGNVWVANTDGNDVVELVGASVPAVTPLAAAVKNNTIGTRP